MLTGRIVRKGSTTSGNYGHAGRPGLVGGSAEDLSIYEVPLAKDLIEVDGHSVAFITPEGKLLDLQHGGKYMEHVIFAIEHKLYDTSPEIHAKKILDNFYTNGSSFGYGADEALSNVLDKGYIRIRIFSGSLIVHYTTNNTNAGLRKIQHLIDKGILPYTKRIMWEYKSYSRRYSIVATMSEFMDAKYIINGELKEAIYKSGKVMETDKHQPELKQLLGKIVKKGGEGSGFHGHSGRPGEVGGSATSSVDVKSLRFDLSKLHSSNKIVPSIKEYGAYWVLADGTVIKATGGHLATAMDLIRSAGINPHTLEYIETSNTTNTFEYNIMFDKGAMRIEHYNRDLQIETNHIDTATLRKLKKMINNGILPYDETANVVWSAGYEQIQSFPMKDLLAADQITTEIIHDYRAINVRDLSKNIDRPRPVYVLKQKFTGHIIKKGGKGSGFTSEAGHAGRPGHQGGSMPRQLQRGSGGEIQARQQQRVKIMEEKYPGIRFSSATYNPLGLEYAKREGNLPPGLDLPQAMYDKTLPKITDVSILNKVMTSNHKWGGASGYTRINTLKFDTGLSFEEIIGSLTELHERDPYKVSFTVDRLGKATAVKIAKGWTIV